MLRLTSKLPKSSLLTSSRQLSGASKHLPPRQETDHAPPPLTQLSEEELAFQDTGKYTLYQALF